MQVWSIDTDIDIFQGSNLTSDSNGQTFLVMKDLESECLSHCLGYKACARRNRKSRKYVEQTGLSYRVLQVNGFGELLATRIIFACAQATQNPICFSLIPELFRKDRTTAMAAYNSAIYMGRALSFAAVIVAGKLGMAKSTGDIGVTMVSHCAKQRPATKEFV